ncbi:MAG: hypothetical protein ABWZ98_09655 [Nakamurella sp.]
MEHRRTRDAAAERELFETMRTTYAVALEPEQQAMIRELRHHLTTIPADERMALIDDIENAIGQHLEDQEYEF